MKLIFGKEEETALIVDYNCLQLYYYHRLIKKTDSIWKKAPSSRHRLGQHCPTLYKKYDVAMHICTQSRLDNGLLFRLPHQLNSYFQQTGGDILEGAGYIDSISQV
uniref:Uncharacterized protein n=1 Tax=Spongospora subterranea TaxID=70186 RepID=A0A0H5R4T1_9EUKA|eukprot:CRZ09158.1 hypothetical protein [Spongospora subterranea]